MQGVPFLPVKSNMASITFCSKIQDPEAIEKFSLKGTVMAAWCWTLFRSSGCPVGEQPQPIEAMVKLIKMGWD